MYVCMQRHIRFFFMYGMYVRARGIMSKCSNSLEKNMYVNIGQWGHCFGAKKEETIQF